MAVRTFSWPYWIVMLVVVATASTFAEQEIMTTEQSGALTCRTSNISFIKAVEWRRADLNDKYVLLYRDGHFELYNEHPSFKNRVDLQDRGMKDGDVSLILKNVTINDTGTYECRVFMGETRSWKSITTISLSVVDPPGQTGGHTEDGGKKDQSVGFTVGLTVCCLLLFAGIIYKFVRCKENSHDLCPKQEFV